MALLESEITRVKYELGYHGLSIYAEPHIQLTALFEQVIKPYVLTGAVTTCSTPVTAAASPTPQTLTLASSSGFALNNMVVVDADSRQERATVTNISGNSITLLLSKAHTGSYPVLVESSETIIREILQELRVLTTGLNGSAGTISSIRSRVGLKKVEDVEFFGGGNTLASQGVDPLKQVLALREYWRDELAGFLGIPRLNKLGTSGGADVSVY